MNREEVLQDLRTRFAGDILDFEDRTPKRVKIEIRPEALKHVASYIFSDLKARFNIATGIDTRRAIEILYHFTLEDINLMVSLRVMLDRENPSVESLAPSMEAANWIEREINEMLGVEFKGHPDMRRLLLPDKWPEGVCPLRQDYEEWDDTAIRDRGI
jgi:Ni,Fe-hydrogenase III component G